MKIEIYGGEKLIYTYSPTGKNHKEEVCLTDYLKNGEEIKIVSVKDFEDE